MILAKILDQESKLQSPESHKIIIKITNLVQSTHQTKAIFFM